MKCMDRNKTPFYYALYNTKTEIEDDYGNKTGQYELSYGNPIRCKANISAAMGETQSRQFGDSISYDKVITLDDPNTPINEYSVLWIDNAFDLDSVIPLSSLPIGAKVKFGKYSVNGETAQDLVWIIAAKSHSCTPAYPTNSITLLAEKILDLRCFDAKEPNNSDSNRQSYGNNRYSVSNIDQWLNKDAAASAWYSAQHSTDQSPNSSSYVSEGTQYAARPGFLNAFSDEEKNAIQTTTIRVVKPTVDGGSYEDISRKIFLPSTTEVGLANENSIAEGAIWAYFSNGGSRVCTMSTQGYNNTPSSSKPSSATTAWYWWLRTPNYSYSYRARGVLTDGALYNGFAYYGSFGVRPAFNLLSTLSVSDTMDSDGCYRVRCKSVSHDYIVKKVARSLNSVSIAVSKVNVQ